MLQPRNCTGYSGYTTMDDTRILTKIMQFSAKPKIQKSIFHEKKKQIFKISIIFGHRVLFESSFTLIRFPTVHGKYAEVRAHFF